MAYKSSVDVGEGSSFTSLNVVCYKSNIKPIEVRFNDGSVYYTSYASLDGTVQNGIYKTIDESISYWIEVESPNPDCWEDKEEVALFLDGLRVKVDGNGKYYASKEHGLFCVYFK